MKQKNGRPKWKCDLALLMGELVGYRGPEFDKPIESFIEDLLSQRDKEIIEILENLKIENPNEIIERLKRIDVGKTIDHQNLRLMIGTYNQALTTAIERIKND